MSMINKAGVQIEAGSKWEMVRFADSQHAPFKVMGFVDSYAVMRRKTCSPICVHINAFGTEYVSK